MLKRLYAEQNDQRLRIECTDFVRKYDPRMPSYFIFYFRMTTHAIIFSYLSDRNGKIIRILAISCPLQYPFVFHLFWSALLSIQTIKYVNSFRSIQDHTHIIHSLFEIQMLRPEDAFIKIVHTKYKSNAQERE